jgi:hypothetical protein
VLRLQNLKTFMTDEIDIPMNQIQYSGGRGKNVPFILQNVRYEVYFNFARIFVTQT